MRDIASCGNCLEVGPTPPVSRDCDVTSSRRSNGTALTGGATNTAKGTCTMSCIYMTTCTEDEF